MIKRFARNWQNAWEQIHYEFADNPNVAVDSRHSNRGFSYNNEIEIGANELGTLDHKAIGYTDYKLRLFEYNYMPEDELERIKEMMRERHIQSGRTYTVVNFLFEQKKAKHTMGSCVTNILISVEDRRDHLYVYFEPNMRIAEATKRIVIDFIYFQKIIQEVLDVLGEAKPVKYKIVFRSYVIYLQSLQAVLLPYLIPGVSYDTDHWLHELIRKQYDKFENPNYKFKSGLRIKKFLKRLQHEQTN